MIENFLHWLGGILAYSLLIVLLYGIWRGTRRQAGRTSGRASHWLRSVVFYLVISLFFSGGSVLGWKPLPWELPQITQGCLLALGSVLYFPGLALILWGRLALGRHYFVSTSTSAQLFKDQPLVTRGPYAIVRHPMYLGILLAALGSLLLYQTWTTLFYACFAPFILSRARREEVVLAAEFGEQWREYCRRVPALIPKLKKKQ